MHRNERLFRRIPERAIGYKHGASGLAAAMAASAMTRD